MYRIPLAVLCPFLFCVSAFAQQSADHDWPRFRGPNGSGISADSVIPDTWSSDDYAWTIELRGTGTSSPVIFGEQMFVTSADSDTGENFLECFDKRSGEKKWEVAVESKPYRMHPQNSFASSTPVVDESGIYFMVGNPESVQMIGCDHDGAEKWRHEFGTFKAQHGFSMSPVLYEDRVVFIHSQQAVGIRDGGAPGDSVAYALATENGEVLWERPLTTTRACYSTPCIFRQEGNADQILCSNTGDGFYSLDPLNGELNWSMPGLELRTVAATVVDGDKVYASNGSGGGGNYLVAIRAGAVSSSGEVVEPEPLFEVRQAANYVPTPLVTNDLLFMFGDRGIVSCYDSTDGTLHWQERLGRGFSGSPVAAGNNIYIIEPEGRILVLRATDDFELIHEIEAGEESRATPAISGDRIYFRTASKVMALGGE
ncbi:MAG: PQQ-binding-like beta-propeller repeat protein [Planctomycetota bacterium]